MKEKKTLQPEELAGKRKKVETASTIGLLLLAIGLVAPFTSLENTIMLQAFKWVYSLGALIYTIARMINVNAEGESIRIKRMRRMEMWAGIAFCVGAFFWFYNSYRLKGFGFSLGVMQDTIMFTLAGALIQIISSWMIAYRQKKESK